MRMGLVWRFDDAEEWRYALELAPEWTKFPLAVDADYSQECALVELAADAGIAPVIDLRTNSHSWIGQHAPPEAWRWDLGNWRNDRLFEGFAAECARVVERFGEWCHDWEVWGEAPCVWTGNFLFEGGNYTRMLRAVREAVREVQPDARLWFGGHGVHGDVGFWEQCEAEGAGELYEVNNLHCFSHDREWATIETAYRNMFARIKGTETARGTRHRLCMTEFGFPTHPDGMGIPFASHVEGSVLSVDEETAAEWFDASLTIFAEEGVEEVCVLTLRDGPPDATHWGSHLGLYRHDWTPKPMLEVWKAWRER